MKVNNNYRENYAILYQKLDNSIENFAFNSLIFFTEMSV